MHRKVWLWWGQHWAVQLYVARYVSLGIHIDFNRPYLDLHLFWFIASVGSRPLITNAVDRHRHTCRGFVCTDEPVL